MQLFPTYMNFLHLVIFSSSVLQQNNPALPPAKPAEVGMSAERLARIEPVILDTLKQGQLPGAVVLVLRHGKICYREAFGSRSKLPEPVPMTVDTVFDLASLTKPIATATSLMILLEQGKFRLQDHVAQHLPEFGRNGKEN